MSQAVSGSGLEEYLSGTGGTGRRILGGGRTSSSIMEATTAVLLTARCQA